MFNLNDDNQFGGSGVFNNGKAGLVKNVKISVEERPVGTNQPHYKLVATDGTGSANQGFYYPEPNPQKDAAANEKTAKMNIGRVLHAAKAVMGDDYVFPEVSSAKEAYDTLFKLIKENSKDKLFNVYATYGTKARPSQYLGLRFFDFIEAATDDTKLHPKAMDMMEPITPDAPSASMDEGWV